MQGLRKQEDKKFEKFFECVQAEAAKRNWQYHKRLIVEFDFANELEYVRN